MGDARGLRVSHTVLTGTVTADVLTNHKPVIRVRLPGHL